MRTLYLKSFPTEQQLNGAYDQDEGVILVTVEGDTYTFVPGAMQNEYPARPLGIPGQYCLLAEDGSFTDTRGDAVLSIERSDPEQASILFVF